MRIFSNKVGERNMMGHSGIRDPFQQRSHRRGMITPKRYFWIYFSTHHSEQSLWEELYF